MTKQEFKDLALVLWEHTQGDLRFGVTSRTLSLEEACKEFGKLDKELAEKVEKFADARETLSTHIKKRFG